MKKIINYFKGLSAFGVMNWIIAIFLCVAVFRACSAEIKYKRLVEIQSKQKIPPSSPVIKNAEELSREIDTAGRERVVYRLSDPIIQKIVDNEQLDSIAEIVNVQAKQIQSITTVAGEFRKENTDLKRKIQEFEDGSSDTIYTYSDPWVSLSGYTLSDTVFRVDSLTMDASIDKIDYYRKKYWFVGKNEYLSNVSFKSPYLRVRGMRTATFRQPEAFLDLDLDVGGVYLHNSRELLLGPKAKISLGRVSFSGGYYINPNGSLGNTWFYGADYSIY